MLTVWPADADDVEAGEAEPEEVEAGEAEPEEVDELEDEPDEQAASPIAAHAAAPTSIPTRSGLFA